MMPTPTEFCGTHTRNTHNRHTNTNTHCSELTPRSSLISVVPLTEDKLPRHYRESRQDCSEGVVMLGPFHMKLITAERTFVTI